MDHYDPWERPGGKGEGGWFMPACTLVRKDTQLLFFAASRLVVPEFSAYGRPSGWRLLIARLSSLQTRPAVYAGLLQASLELAEKMQS